MKDEGSLDCCADIKYLSGFDTTLMAMVIAQLSGMGLRPPAMFSPILARPNRLRAAPS